VNSFGGFLGAAFVGLVAVVAAGGCSRSELDLGPGVFNPDGGVFEGGDEVPDGFVQPEGAPPPSCGNGSCDNGETCATCALDCGVCSTCGDGTCNTSAGEDCSNCPQDCGDCVSCGDGFCTMPQENCQNCAVDCGACPGCGDGKCTPPNEDCFSCPQDCGKCVGCGDGTCQSNETCASCPQDCGSCDSCGNGVCQAPLETCVNCPADCGQCPVHDCLQELTCAIGCFSGMGGGDGCFSGGISGATLVWSVDCIAQGCPTGNLLAGDAVSCIIGALTGGQCMGFSIGCLMSACSAQFTACFSQHCPPGQGG